MRKAERRGGHRLIYHAYPNRRENKHRFPTPSWDAAAERTPERDSPRSLRPKFLHLLGCRVIELVLSWAREAALDAAVGPQPPDHVGQVVRKEALLLSRRRKGKELLGVILQGAAEAQFSWRWAKNGRLVVESPSRSRPLLYIRQNSKFNSFFSAGSERSESVARSLGFTLMKETRRNVSVQAS